MMCSNNDFIFHLDETYKRLLDSRSEIYRYPHTSGNRAQAGFKCNEDLAELG